MFTEVEPAKALEIENAFRAARTVGEFVAAVDQATAALNPDGSPEAGVSIAFSKAVNDGLIAALGAEYPLKPIPDVALLIDVHASLTGVVDALIADKYAAERANETA